MSAIVDTPARRVLSRLTCSSSVLLVLLVWPWPSRPACVIQSDEGTQYAIFVTLTLTLLSPNPNPRLTLTVTLSISLSLTLLVTLTLNGPDHWACEKEKV
jgi:hypothetical protein